jgi:hypothetical protein
MDRWSEQLAAAIRAALEEAPLAGSDIHMLAIDLQPWHGTLQLALLSSREAEKDPELADAAEMASWEHFEFTESLAGWAPAANLARQMCSAYEAADDKRATGLDYFKACARALADVFSSSPGYTVVLAHPDDGEEYFKLVPRQHEL